MADWSLARQLARFAANAGSEPPPLPRADLPAMVAESERYLREYTGLAPQEIPPPEPVSRAEWAEVNVDSLAKLLGPVVDRLGGRFEGTGPFAGALRGAASATVEAETGLVLGYMSQRVLGQYELSLLEPERQPRLLFVEPNLAKAIQELDVEPDSFMRWIVLHEVTHVLQFQGVPWLREHMGDLLRNYLATMEVRIERGAAGGLPSLPDFGAFVERFREGGLMALVQTEEQRLIFDRIQAVMSVIEGYSEHVMDAVGEQVLPEYAGLRDAMERRRRSRSAPERALQKLLGLDLKMRQYEIGKRFCDAVNEKHGIETLNRVWEAPQAIPTLAEIDDPDAWVERIRDERAAA